MGIIYLMLIVSLIVALFFLGSFFWATKDGQFEDDYSPAVRILFDEDLPVDKTGIKNKTNLETDGITEV
jgi:cbb3-type cytochrome oxidase maturation protein